MLHYAAGGVRRHVFGAINVGKGIWNTHFHPASGEVWWGLKQHVEAAWTQHAERRMSRHGTSVLHQQAAVQPLGSASLTLEGTQWSTLRHVGQSAPKPYRPLGHLFKVQQVSKRASKVSTRPGRPVKLKQ